MQTPGGRVRYAEGDMPAHIALLADYREEGWPSMDLVADMTLAHLGAAAPPERIALVRPPMPRHFSAADAAAGRGFTADRALARYWHYPRIVRAQRRDFDLFHVLDHSYAHLASSVPAGRAIVTCHDVDAFRSVLESGTERRSAAYRYMTGLLLAGLRRAARVLCISAATRDELAAHGVVPPDRLEVVHLGVYPGCTSTPDPHADAALAGLLGPVRRGAPELLHVGSTIARKRIDVLLRAFAAVHAAHPEARLVRVGGALTAEQQALAERLGIAARIESLPFIARGVLAALYRRAALVLQTSSAEGFGLPVAEAMACGTPVIASDLPVLREVGGAGTTYVPVGDDTAFGAAAIRLLEERAREPEAWTRRQQDAVATAAAFTWEAYAARVLDVYRRTWDDVRAARRAGARA